MFGFGRRKRERAKREALAIGERVVGRINGALAQWRADSLESRRTMLDNSFAERIVGLVPEDRLSFETVAEIEALALMKNWVEGTPDYQSEFVRLVDQDTLDCLAVIGIENEVQGHVERNIAEVTRDLENDLDLAITEAVEQRGQSPLRSGHRDLAERCLREEPFIDSLTVREALDYVASLARTGPAASKFIAVVKRLYDLAFFEHAISDEERSLALTRANAVQADVEAALQDRPDSLAAFNEAVTYQKERARHCGVGSLQWKLEEEAVPPNEIIAFIAREDHAELLPAFLEMMEPDVIGEIRCELLNAMVSERAASGQSAVEVLSSLALAQDAALTIQLDASELLTLREAGVHRAAAEELVAQLLRREAQ